MNDADTAEVVSSAAAIRQEMARVVIGQETLTEELLAAFIAGGHVLLEGVPGLAKTLAVRCLAAVVDLTYSRIQFTPDLLPQDITGVNVFDARSMQFQFRPGPLFADIVLADEVNRAPAKTQSAMLEAMQEKQVTVDGTGHRLSELFMVVATQNPVEYEGTYPLPEAQLDRFLMKIQVDYPSRETEVGMLSTMEALGPGASAPHALLGKRVGADAIRSMRRLVHEVKADRSVQEYIVEIVRRSRELANVSLGASPRAAVMTLQAAKALALLRGISYVRPDEVQAVAHATLRHRITLTPEAQIEGVTPDDCINQLLKELAVPR
ncbi:MAG TPA: MoxR family ATPase [Spirochaetia bacterium]|nr:MoxR family ATPase [Spirochaetia bacterium]